MRHLASHKFRQLLADLPAEVQALARKNFELLKADPRHPSLHFKKTQGTAEWSVRIGGDYRALGREVGNDMRWHWIGTHSEYNRKLRRR